MDGMSSPQDIVSLRRGMRLNNPAYIINVLLILTKQLENGGEAAANSLVTAGVCGLLEQLFDVFRGSKSVCLNALTLFNMLISLSINPASTSSSNVWKKLLSQPESCSSIVTAIAAHMGDSSIASQGIKLLFYLSSDDLSLKKLLIHQSNHIKSSGERAVSRESSSNSVCDVLVNVMLLYSSNSSLMKCVCRAIYNLTYEDDGGCRSYLVELGVTDLILRGILLPRNATTETNSILEVRRSSSASDNPQKLSVNCANTGEESEEVITSELTTDSDIENTDISGNQAVKSYNTTTAENTNTQDFYTQKKQWIERVSQLDTGEKFDATQWCDEIELAKWGLRALGSLCRHHPDNQETFNRLGACSVVIAVGNKFIGAGKNIE